MSAAKSFFDFFQQATLDSATVELHLDHPLSDFHKQTGMVYGAHRDFAVIGPEGTPVRVCIPYDAIRWFRRMDNQV
ncbi:MAG: hypothetical protein KJO07_05675 [Deltaproteobacteria bacterium]|jgi:hypothetical protein|nr:hypothetical protein [Deltaproteobacteria bacterium]